MDQNTTSRSPLLRLLLGFLVAAFLLLWWPGQWEYLGEGTLRVHRLTGRLEGWDIEKGAWSLYTALDQSVPKPLGRH